jgi:hypothetical protein
LSVRVWVSELSGLEKITSTGDVGSITAIRIPLRHGRLKDF